MVGIKGFEMPKNCRKCKIKVGICRVWEDAFALGNTQRPANCPLIEIEESKRIKEILECIDTVKNSRLSENKKFEHLVEMIEDICESEDKNDK